MDEQPRAICGTRRNIGERRRIAPRNALARRDLVREELQLLDQHRRLDGVEPAVEADAGAIVFVAALAVDAQAAQHRRKLVVVGENGAAVAVAAERLGGKEARCRRRRDRAQPAVPVGCAKSLRRIVKDEQAVRCRDRGNALMVGRLAEEIDWNHGLRVKP